MGIKDFFQKLITWFENSRFFIVLEKVGYRFNPALRKGQQFGYVRVKGLFKNNAKKLKERYLK